MPELPEVETIARGLRPSLIGKTIVDVSNDWPGHIVKPDFPELRHRIIGQSFTSISRRGKYIVFHLSSGESLIIHLKMSGQLSIAQAENPADKYVHTVFTLSDGHELRFRDIRKFGRVYLVRDSGEVLGNLGPEPLSEAFTPAWLHDQLMNRNRVLKPLLLDQTFIAGIGNIYADEALFQARLHPQRRSNSLSHEEARALQEAIRQVLELGIHREGASIDATYRKPDGTMGQMQNSFFVYGREGERCYRCGDIVHKVKLGGRGTHFCNRCQI
jgi:formamidopyrimidine-DNA glycosylase